MSAPHSLAALRWSNLVENISPDQVEERLRKGGWDPQWRFGMYKEAHYHSVSGLNGIKGYSEIRNPTTLFVCFCFFP